MNRNKINVLFFPEESFWENLLITIRILTCSISKRSFIICTCKWTKTSTRYNVWVPSIVILISSISSRYEHRFRNLHVISIKFLPKMRAMRVGSPASAAATLWQHKNLISQLWNQFVRDWLYWYETEWISSSLRCWFFETTRAMIQIFV